MGYKKYNKLLFNIIDTDPEKCVRKKFGTLNINRKDAVFTAFVAEYKLPEMYGEDADKVINLVAMQSRWDGRYGFAGGYVDNNETLIEAAKRELEEELGIKDENFVFEEVCTHEFSIGQDRTMNTHLYIVKIPLEELKDILANSFKAEHFASENCGNVIVHLENYGDKGFKHFIKNNFAGSAKEELIVLANILNSQLTYS